MNYFFVGPPAPLALKAGANVKRLFDNTAPNSKKKFRHLLFHPVSAPSFQKRGAKVWWVLIDFKTFQKSFFKLGCLDLDKARIPNQHQVSTIGVNYGNVFCPFSFQSDYGQYLCHRKSTLIGK
jgi:hypothetical protein